MSTEPIDVVVTDKVSPEVRNKFLNIAQAALEAANNVDKVQAALAKVNASPLAQLAAAQDKIASSSDKAAASYLKQETALSKAIEAEAKAEIATNRLAAQLDKQAESVASVAAAASKAASAVNAFGETEADVAARLASVAQAGAALAKQQQGIGITATEAAGAEKTLTAATVASGNAAKDAAARYTNYMSALNTIGKATPGGAAPGLPNPAEIAKSTVALKEAGTVTAGVTRELLVLGHEVISGNFSRIPGSMIVLAERTGGFGSAIGALLGLLNPVTIAIGLVVGALALYETAVTSADTITRQFNNTIKLTGNAAGFSVESFNAVVAAIAKANDVSIASSREIVQELQKNGALTADEIGQLGDAAVKLSKLTGESTDDIIKSYQRLVKAPNEYANELQEKYGIVIAPAIQAHIRDLQNQGNQAEATRVLSKALFDYLGQNAPEVLTGLSKLFHDLGVSISNTFDRFKAGVAGIGKLGSITEQLKDAQSTVAQLEQFQASNDKQAAAGGANSAAAQQKQQIAERLQAAKDEVNNLQDALQITNDQGVAQGKATQSLREAKLAAEGLSDAILSVKSNGQKANEIVEKFRLNLQKAISNPATANSHDTLYAQAHQAEIEAGLRKKYQGAAAKVPATLDENRAAILAKINAQLGVQLAYTDQINEVRTAGQKVDAIDAQLASHTKAGRLAPLQALTQAERDYYSQKELQIQQAKRVEAAQDSIYNDTDTAKVKVAYEGELAINNLLKNHTISAEEAAQAQGKLNYALQSAKDPLLQFNKEMQQQNDLLASNLDANQRAAQSTVNSINNSLAPQGKKLTGDQQANVLKQVTDQQALNRVTQTYDQIVAQTIGANQQLQASQVALNKARDAGIITAEQYATATTQLVIEQAKLNLDNGVGKSADLALASVGRLVSGYKNALSGLSDSFGSFFETIDSGFADSIGKAIVEGGSLKDSLLSVAKQGVEGLISSLVKLGIQYLLNAALGKTIQTSALATATASSVAAGAATAVAWAPAAALVSLASFGANSIPADAGILATSALTESLALASLAGFQDGGYTGDVATSKIAGVVHGQEFVMDADATRRNRPALEAMQRGATLSNAVQPNITIEDHTSGGVTFTPAPSLSANEVRMIARDTVRNEAPNVIAKEIARPNSDTSKALRSSYKIQKVTV